MKFKAKITDKTITFENLPYARFHLSKFEGKPVYVTVDKIHNRRSLKQNAYYWMCLEIISDHTGHTPDELHKVFKGRFLKRKDVLLNGKTYTLSGSTSDLTKGEFVDYMLNISAEAGQMGISLPSIEDYKQGLDSAMLSTEN